MTTKACIFVDGENFRHSLVRLFEPPVFHNRDYLPRNAQWPALFDWVVGRIADDAFRVRTYWYVVEHLDCFPYGLEDLERDHDKAESVVRRHEPHRTALDAIADQETRSERVQGIISELSEKQRQMHRRFDGWTTIQNSIARREEAIEFRRAG